MEFVSLTEGYDLKWTFAKTFWSWSSFLYNTSMLLEHFLQCSQAFLMVSFDSAESLHAFDSQDFGSG